MTQESKFIEILGESSYIENPEKYPVEMEIRLTASEENKNTVLEQFSELESLALELLSKNKDELEKLIDGGRRISSYTERRKISTVVSRNFLLHFVNMEILDRFWGRVLEFNNNDTHLISFEPLQPFFSAKKEHEQAAHNQALIHARERALKLVKATNLSLGSLISAKQLALTEKNSGAYSDEDWWGDTERFRPKYHIGGVPQVELEEPERIVFVRYLVKYELQNA